MVIQVFLKSLVINSFWDFSPYLLNWIFFYMLCFCLKICFVFHTSIFRHDVSPSTYSAFAFRSKLWLCFNIFQSCSTKNKEFRKALALFLYTNWQGGHTWKTIENKIEMLMLFQICLNNLFFSSGFLIFNFGGNAKCTRLIRICIGFKTRHSVMRTVLNDGRTCDHWSA